MTVSELRTLVDNLEEYIHVPGGIDRLKKMVLHLAVSGQLVSQDPSEGTGEELYKQIQGEKAELARQGKIKKPKRLSVVVENDVLPSIPDSWKRVRLGDIGLVGTGATPSRDNPQYYGGNIPWVTSTLTSQDTIYSTNEYITQKALDETNCSLYPEGSIIIAMYGQGKTRGQVSQLGVEAATNQACAVFRKVSDAIDLSFIRRNLELNYDSMREAAAGGAQPNLNVQKIKDILISLPPLAEQKRIVAKVENVFTLINQLAEAYKSEQAERSKLVASSLAQLAKGEVGAKGSLALTHLSEIMRTKADAKILRQTILHLAVSGQLVPQDPTEGTGEALYQQIQAEKLDLIKRGKLKKQKPLPTIDDDEALFTIPSDWKWARLGDLSDIFNGNSIIASNCFKYYIF